MFSGLNLEDCLCFQDVPNVDLEIQWLSGHSTTQERKRKIMIQLLNKVIHTKPLLYLAEKLQHTLIDRIWERVEKTTHD